MANAPKSAKVARKPVGPRVFFFIYKGQLEGEPTITFDKMQAVDTLLKANEAGDTSLKMKKMELPRGTRKKAEASAASTA